MDHITFRQTMDSLLTGRDPHRQLRKMAEDGVLKAHFPELDALRGVVQPEKWHPEGDVFEHTLLMLSHMAWKSVILGWAVLLHDIGKPAAQTFTPDGVPHFYGHEALGGDMAPAILRRYGFTEEETLRIAALVRNHMRYTHLHLARRKKQLKILESPDLPLEMELHRLDCISSNGIMENYILLLDLKREWQETPPEPVPFLKGRDLLDLGFTPGPVFAKILRDALECQKSGTITSRADALRWADALRDQSM